MQIKTIELTQRITNLIKKSDLNLKELSRAEATKSSDEQSKSRVYCIDADLMCSSKKYANNSRL